MGRKPLSTEGPSRPLVVRVTPSLDRALHHRSAEDGVSIAEVVRRALVRELAANDG